MNVGAGTGSYEPTDRLVVAVEPSRVMIQQRALDAAPTIQASATALPFRDDEFDAAMAILTLHHWPNLEKGLLELKRVARSRIVIVTWDPSSPGFWLTHYCPHTLTADRRVFPVLPKLAHVLGSMTVFPLPIPHDCADGFLGAYWRRPDAYLHEDVRAAISTFSKLTDARSSIEQLRQDLATGEWHRRYGNLLSLPELDLGYRIIVCNL